MTELAVFPIPNCVAFPGAVFPLHVFEPRYRDMVHHCVETGLPLAVCHVEKEVKPAKADQTPEEALHSNQALYRPVSIVAAGHCELVETLPDGRLLINVHLTERYELTQEVQLLPFQRYQATVFSDRELNEQEIEAAEQLKDKLLHRLLALTADRPLIQATLEGDHWQTMPADVFSFQLFSLLHTDADLMQALLANPDPIERLSVALALLNEVQTPLKPDH